METIYIVIGKKLRPAQAIVMGDIAKVPVWSGDIQIMLEFSRKGGRNHDRWITVEEAKRSRLTMVKRANGTDYGDQWMKPIRRWECTACGEEHDSEDEAANCRCHGVRAFYICPVCDDVFHREDECAVCIASHDDDARPE